MTDIHLAYTVCNADSYQSPESYRLTPESELFWPSPLHAPYSITYFALKALRKKFRTHLYHLAEKTKAELGDNDLFLGHLFTQTGNFGFKGMQADYSTVGWQTLKAYQGTGKTCIFQPFVYAPEIVEMDWLKEGFLELCDAFIAICGKYWEKSWYDSPLCANNRHFLRINMCLDTQNYPYVRKNFQTKGQRRFLYVGHTSKYKNTAQLEAIAANYPGFQGFHIGTGEIKGWIKIAEFASLTPDLLSKLAENIDVFVSTSTADAQATTILEQMAAGFMIACTPESGYEHDSIVKLHVSDTNFNCHQIDNIQKMDSAELQYYSQANRKLVETEYSWDQSMNQVVSFVEKMLT